MSAADKIASARALIEPLRATVLWGNANPDVMKATEAIADLADLADAQAQEIEALEAALRGERERIASALDAEADTTPCPEDAAVVRDCARLVRADFSYDAADALADLADAQAQRITAAQQAWADYESATTTDAHWAAVAAMRATLGDAT